MGRFKFSIFLLTVCHGLVCGVAAERDLLIKPVTPVAPLATAANPQTKEPPVGGPLVTIVQTFLGLMHSPVALITGKKAPIPQEKLTNLDAKKPDHPGKENKTKPSIVFTTPLTNTATQVTPVTTSP